METCVSVIMPSYNSEKTIEKTIESVMNQTFTEWELIVIDDNSTDKTVELVQKYLLDKRIKLIKKNSNAGVADSRNIGMKAAIGTYIAFLDSDDIWKSTKLAKQISFMKTNQINFSCTYYGKINMTDQVIKEAIKSKSVMNYKELLKYNMGNSTVIFNRAELGEFTVPLIKKRNDYALWLKIIRTAKEVYCLPEVLGYHRVHEESLSYKKRDLIKYHYIVYNEFEKLNFFYSMYLIFYWSGKTLIKKVVKK